MIGCSPSIGIFIGDKLDRGCLCKFDVFWVDKQRNGIYAEISLI